MKSFSTRSIGAAFTGDSVVIRLNCLTITDERRFNREAVVSSSPGLAASATLGNARIKDIFNPKSGCALQPMVGRFGYPGITNEKIIQLRHVGVASFPRRVKGGRNRFAVGNSTKLST